MFTSDMGKNTELKPLYHHRLYIMYSKITLYFIKIKFLIYVINIVNRNLYSESLNVYQSSNFNLFVGSNHIDYFNGNKFTKKKTGKSLNY